MCEKCQTCLFVPQICAQSVHVMATKQLKVISPLCLRYFVRQRFSQLTIFDISKNKKEAKIRSIFRALAYNLVELSSVKSTALFKMEQLLFTENHGVEKGKAQDNLAIFRE